MDEDRVKQLSDAIASALMHCPGARDNSAPYIFYIEYTAIEQQVVVKEGAGVTLQNRPSSSVVASIQAPFTGLQGDPTMTDFPGFGNYDALTLWIVSQIAYYGLEAAGTIKDKIVDKAAEAVVDKLKDKTRKLWHWIKGRLSAEKPTQKMLEEFEKDPKTHLRDVASEVKKAIEYDDDFKEAFLKDVEPLINEIVDLKAQLAMKQTSHAPQTSIAIGPGAKATNIQGNGNTTTC
jgi:hypothetical protein